MNTENLSDNDREHILILVLSEAAGDDVQQALAEYPQQAVGLFRKVAYEAQLVDTTLLLNGSDGTAQFSGTTALTERGKKRLKEMRSRMN